MKVTFFGHKDTPQSVKQQIEDVLERLISIEGADVFYVGNQGSFDGMVRDSLRKMKVKYPHIKFFVVLAYMPEKRDTFDIENYAETIFPEGLEKVPKRFAISARNLFMIDVSDTVVTYITNSAGNSAKFRDMAIKKGKEIISLA